MQAEDFVVPSIWPTGSSDQMHSNDNAKSEVLQEQGKHSQSSKENEDIRGQNYQMQLMLLEQQNKKRLMRSRSPLSAD